MLADLLSILQQGDAALFIGSSVFGLAIGVFMSRFNIAFVATHPVSSSMILIIVTLLISCFDFIL